MKVLIVGPEWHYPFLEFVVNGFKENNTETDSLKYRHSFIDRQQYILRKISQLKLKKIIGNKINENFINKIYEYNHLKIKQKLLNNNYDLIFIIKGDYIHNETINYIKNNYKNSKIYCWLIDEPYFNFESKFKLNLYKESIKNLSVYDKLFVFDSYFVDGLKRFNKNTFYLPFGYDPNYSYKIKNTKKIYDISFVGNMTNDRYGYLEILKNKNLGLFGAGDFKDLENKVIKKMTSMKETNEVFNQSLINFNLHHCQTVYGLNTRNFEVLGSGNFLITDYRKDLENFFEVGKDLESYKTKEELKEKIEYYLKNKDKIFEIAKNGYKKVFKKYTYKNSLKKVLDLIR